MCNKKFENFLKIFKSTLKLSVTKENKGGDNLRVYF